MGESRREPWVATIELGHCFDPCEWKSKRLLQVRNGALMNLLGLRLIANIMDWKDDGIATAEYNWLKLAAATKYDGYSDFRAGSRFIESLATWLKQFEPADRDTAYRFVKERMVYISNAELYRVIDAFFPETITPHYRALAAEKVGVRPHEVWGDRNAKAMFDRILRRTLFVGMSDGSRIDILRRSNSQRISQEQVVPMMNIGSDKWRDLGKNLCEAGQEPAKFEHVFLIDDFTASGTTFIRKIEGEWKGKLRKFENMVAAARKDLGDDFPIINRYALHIHHYISTAQANAALQERVKLAVEEWSERSFSSIEISEGMQLPASLKLEKETDQAMLNLCEKYYDHSLFLRLKKHASEAGQTDMKMGYADCALPLVLEHNTPNNSIPIIWAETDGKEGHRMQPLFRRRDRHG